ncbi:helix-turn-helix domain-containing protein [Nocardioides acrostichi]
MKWRITRDQRAEAVRLYQTGLSLNEVARQLGVSRWVVKNAAEQVAEDKR